MKGPVAIVDYRQTEIRNTGRMLARTLYRGCHGKDKGKFLFQVDLLIPRKNMPMLCYEPSDPVDQVEMTRADAAAFLVEAWGYTPEAAAGHIWQG